MTDKFQIEKVLSQYDLGQIISINDQSHGYANINFGVECSMGKVFVRFSKQQTVKNIEQEILLMSVLKEGNFKTAYPLATSDGSYLTYSNDVPVIVYELLEGDLPEINPRVVSEIAIETGFLSRIDYPVELNKANAISAHDSREIIRSEAFRKSSFTDVTENFLTQFASIEETLSVDLPVGIVHGDIFPDNTLFKGDSLVGIIDFEEFAIDKLLFDVGMTINGFCFEGINLDLDLLGRFILEYNRIRELTEQELVYLVDYISWGAVGMTSWHLHQLLYKRNNEQLRRVRTLLERARLINLGKASLESYLSSIV